MVSTAENRARISPIDLVLGPVIILHITKNMRNSARQNSGKPKLWGNFTFPAGPPVQSKRPRPASATGSRATGGAGGLEPGRGVVRPRSPSRCRFSAPRNVLNDPGSPSASQPVILPQPGGHWKTGLSPSRPKHAKLPRGGGGGSSPEYSDDTSHRPQPADVHTRRHWRSVLWRKAWGGGGWRVGSPEWTPQLRPGWGHRTHRTPTCHV